MKTARKFWVLILKKYNFHCFKKFYPTKCKKKKKDKKCTKNENIPDKNLTFSMLRMHFYQIFVRLNYLTL